MLHLDRLNKLLTVPWKYAIELYLKRKGKPVPLLTSSSDLLKLSVSCPTIDPYTPFEVPSVFEILRRQRTPYTFVHDSDFGRIKVGASRIPLSRSARFNYVLLSIDEYFHHKGLKHLETLKHMREIDSFLDTLFSRIFEELGDFSYVIISDHGFCSVSKRIDIERLLDPFDHANTLMFTDATMARFWFSSEESQAEVETRLRGLPWGKVLDENLKRQFGIDFSHRFYGDTIYLLEPGVMPCPDSWAMCMGRRPMVALHGYDPRRPSMNGFLTSNIDIKGDPIHITDVLPTILDHWGLQIPEQIEGVSRK
jgi:hypothetical protein